MTVKPTTVSHSVSGAQFVILKPLETEREKALMGHGWKASLGGAETGKFGRKQETGRREKSLRWEKGKVAVSNALI